LKSRATVEFRAGHEFRAADTAESEMHRARIGSRRRLPEFFSALPAGDFAPPRVFR
jgi:hypothetical protein